MPRRRPTPASRRPTAAQCCRCSRHQLPTALTAVDQRGAAGGAPHKVVDERVLEVAVPHARPAVKPRAQHKRRRWRVGGGTPCQAAGGGWVRVGGCHHFGAHICRPLDAPPPAHTHSLLSWASSLVSRTPASLEPSLRHPRLMPCIADCNGKACSAIRSRYMARGLGVEGRRREGEKKHFVRSMRPARPHPLHILHPHSMRLLQWLG